MDRGATVNPGRHLTELSVARVSLWRVPALHVDKARESMGGLDLDLSVPSPCWLMVMAQWYGRVFLMPPQTRGGNRPYIARLLQEIAAGNVEQAVLLTNNSTDTKWWQQAGRIAARICFVDGRIKFTNSHSDPALPVQGQTLMYFGAAVDRFAAVFADVGRVCKRYGT